MEPIETITPFEAGKVLHMNAESIRAGLRANRFNFGVAIPPAKKGGKWNYNIVKSKFLEYAGIEEEK